MTKADLIEQVYLKVGLPRTESVELVEQVLEIIKETLEQGENVKISGFGSFNIREKRPRRGRNPQTGEPLEITQRKILSFKPSQKLRNAINQETYQMEQILSK